MPLKIYQKTLVSVSAPIRKAIAIIDRGSAQIALVVNRKGKLMGTVTDGDVRRGILKGISLKEPVSRVMNATPIVARVDHSKDFILRLMKQNFVHQIPILDPDDKVVGLELLSELFHAEAQENQVVIMAGGLGRRLSPITDDIPKPLISVGEKPILETIINNFREYGFRDFLIAVNYKDHMIKNYFKNGSKWDVRIQYLSEDKRLGTAGALSLIKHRPKKPFFVMNGDLLTKVNFNQLLNFHLETKVAATMCVREYDFQVPYGVVAIHDQFIHRINEKPVHKFFVNAGIYVLNPSVFDFIPKKEFFDMPQLFDELIRCKHKAAAFPIREYWLDIGRIDDLERAKMEFNGVFQAACKGSNERIS